MDDGRHSFQDVYCWMWSGWYNGECVAHGRAATLELCDAAMDNLCPI